MSSTDRYKFTVYGTTWNDIVTAAEAEIDRFIDRVHLEHTWSADINGDFAVLADGTRPIVEATITVEWPS